LYEYTRLDAIAGLLYRDKVKPPAEWAGGYLFVLFVLLVSSEVVQDERGCKSNPDTDDCDYCPT
jgi:hypothetical protein